MKKVDKKVNKLKRLIAILFFKERYRERYMIEAKNSELKNKHGYGVANSSGLFGMQIQGGISIFTVNIKRILTILGDK